MEKNSVKLLFTIVDRGKGQKVSEALIETNVHFSIVCLGRGTASSAMLEYLGLGETEKDVVISVVPDSEIPHALDLVNNKFFYNKRCSGIAFVVRIGSVAGRQTLDLISGAYLTREDVK